MAAFAGRKALLKKGITTVAAIRTRTMTINNEPIDLTSDDDNGFRALMNDPGTKTMDISFEGVAKDSTMITSVMSTTDIVETMSIQFPTIGTFAGDFAVTSFEIGAPYNEAATFSCSLQSAGPFTFTAGA